MTTGENQPERLAFARIKREWDRMITQAELVATFGSDRLSLVPASTASGWGLSHSDQTLLTKVGLPVKVCNIYTSQVDGGPEQFSLHEFQAAGEQNRTLVIGGLPGDRAYRYFLDIDLGYVGLIIFQDARSRAEVVNRSLTTFLGFLAEFEKYARGLVDQATLEPRLHAMDPIAFERPDAWWRAAVDAAPILRSESTR